MILEQKTIEEINKDIRECVKSSNKIENGNYILAMLLKDIRDGKVVDIEGVVKWCFEGIKMNKLVSSVLKDIGDKEDDKSGRFN